MIKNILTYRLSFLHKALLFLGLYLALGTTTTFAQFAVSEDFRGAGNPDIIIGDDAVLTSGNPDPVNGGWLRLTPATTYKKGYAYVNKTFPSSLGVLVDFEFKMWRPTTADGADGIGVFLFDGTVNPFALGGYGGSLGYAPNGGAGLKGGYVGIGLDAYGNFSNASEGRVGGPGVRPNAVVLRGPTTTNAATTNPFLAGTTIGINAGNFTYGNVTTTTNNNRAQDILDYNTNTTVRPADATYYRRIQIEIERLTTGGQYKISVRWKTSPTATTFTDITSYTTTDVPPGLLKLGFAASTGGDINYHEIRNLLVTTPNNMRVKKTANKDFIRTIAGSGSENQITYTIEVTNDTPDPVFNIDFLDELTDLSGTLIPKYDATLQPNGFQITGITSTGFTSGTLSQALLSNRITGTMSMAANSTATVTVTGTLRNYLPAGGFLVNTATAKPPLDDDLNNNTSKVETPVLVEGIDFATTHSVDQNCANGSNTFTINVANIGVVAADIGGSSGKKLRMAITVPSTTGFAVAAVTTNGWTLIGTGVVSGNNTTYTYESNQAATVSSGGAYSYPIVYTVTKSGASAAYTATAVATYFTTSNNSNAETGSTTNNTASVNVVSKPSAPSATTKIYYCQGDPSPSQLTATVTPLSGNSLK